MRSAGRQANSENNHPPPLPSKTKPSPGVQPRDFGLLQKEARSLRTFLFAAESDCRVKDNFSCLQTVDLVLNSFNRIVERVCHV